MIQKPEGRKPKPRSPEAVEERRIEEATAAFNSQDALTAYYRDVDDLAAITKPCGFVGPEDPVTWVKGCSQPCLRKAGHGGHHSSLPPPLEHDRLMGASLLLPPCGCNVVGAGTSPDPIRIAFCAGHRKTLA